MISFVAFVVYELSFWQQCLDWQQLQWHVWLFVLLLHPSCVDEHVDMLQNKLLSLLAFVIVGVLDWLIASAHLYYIQY